MTRAARHAQEGTALSIRQAVNLGAEAVPATAEGGLRLFLLGRARRAHVRAPDRAVQQHGGQNRIGLPVGHSARQTPRVAPVGLAAIDRVPLPVRGRQRAPRRAHLPLGPYGADYAVHVGKDSYVLGMDAAVGNVAV